MILTPGAFIATLRKEKGLTQRELAEMLSVSDKTVSHWEREESSPDISLLPLIAEIFDITVDELLKGERKALLTEDKPAEEKDTPKDTASLYVLESAFNKFKAKNFISAALSVIAVLCGFFVQYFKTVDPGYLVFLIITVVAVLLTAVFRSGFSSHLNSQYIEKDIIKDYVCKANRVTALSGYFSLFCFTGYSMYVALFYIPYFTVVLFGISAAAGAVFLCETILRKKDLLKSSGKTLEIRRITALRILSVFLSLVLLWFGLISLSSTDKETLIYKNAEYTLFEDSADFIEYMQTEKSAPGEIITGLFHFSPEDKGNEYTFYPDFGYDNTYLEVISPDYDEEIVFTYNNLEVADYRQTDGSFIVYTHGQLIDAVSEAEKEMTVIKVIHTVYFLTVIASAFILYRLIKRRLLKSKKSDTLTLIKNF